MDVIRCIALLFVVSTHFFFHMGFGSKFFIGEKMLFITIMRDFTVSCVPLFLMLTGYLMCKKRLSKSYYKGIVKTYSIYVLACIAYLVYRLIVEGESFTLGRLVSGILDFSILGYAWYLEMYLGLFLLIPFLNIIYDHLDSQQKKKWLIVTCLILTALPHVLNIHNFVVEGWWLNPRIPADYQQILPDSWIFMSPVTYYFIGCYLREYPLKMNKITNIGCLVLSIVAMGSYDYFRSKDYVHTPGLWQDNASLFCVITSVFLFNLLANCKFEKLPKCFHHILRGLSNLCFGAYLVSCIFDEIVYGYIDEVYAGVDFLEKVDYFPIIVPIVYVASLLLSFVLNCIYGLLCKVFVLVKKYPVFYKE